MHFFDAGQRGGGILLSLCSQDPISPHDTSAYAGHTSHIIHVFP
jgi:hypothetical protein